jgi:hypothetical protein
MKKIRLLVLIGILILNAWGTVAHTNQEQTSLKTIANNTQHKERLPYTHTVFVEIATSQGCPPCHSWNTNILNAYNSGNYDFEYVEMIVYDHGWNILNYDAYAWKNMYGISSYPTTILDGNFQQIVGNYPNLLPGALDTCGNRMVADIEATLTVEWLGDATIQVNISLLNHEAVAYTGHIRACITEIISRYDTSGGSPYHFGFLDYAFDTDISLDPGTTYVDSAVWNGNEHQDAHGNTFGDIVPSNIQVTMGVFDDTTGYVDETVKGRINGWNMPPNEPKNPDPHNGETDVDINANLYWIGSDPDPADTLTYDVYFGTSNPPPLVKNNQTVSVYNPEIMEYETLYYWQIVAWDDHGASTEGPLWSFTTQANPNEPPASPTISGPNRGKAGSIYKYSFITTDPNDDELVYYIDWGDGYIEEWIGPYDSEEEFTLNHRWDEEGLYTIQAKAKDTHGAEGTWGYLEIEMPRQQDSQLVIQFLKHILHRFPLLEKALSIIYPKQIL